MPIHLIVILVLFHLHASLVVWPGLDWWLGHELLPSVYSSSPIWNCVNLETYELEEMGRTLGAR